MLTRLYFNSDCQLLLFLGTYYITIFQSLTHYRDINYVHVFKLNDILDGILQHNKPTMNYTNIYMQNLISNENSFHV